MTAGSRPDCARRGDGLRTCVGCGRRAERASLVRIAASPRGLDVGPGAGRGAWVCGRACLDGAGGARLARALRRPVAGDEIVTIRARLEAQRDTVLVARTPSASAELRA